MRSQTEVRNGHWRTGDPCYEVEEESLNYVLLEHLAEEISRHGVGGEAWCLLAAYREMQKATVWSDAYEMKQGNPRIARHHEKLGTSKEGSSPGPSEKA